MLPWHDIVWIANVTYDKVELKDLKPGESPRTTFAEVGAGTIYAYCNLHGLWKTDFTSEEDYVNSSEAACSAEFEQGCIIPD